MTDQGSIVRTVLGDVPAAALGLTLAHEHLLLDLRNQFMPPSDPEKLRLSRDPVGPATRELLARNPYALCFKSLLVEHGGRGDAHVVADILPALLEAGVDLATIDTLTIANPARVLALPAPGRPAT
jgi:predicted metal-dependent phosphotriesterase family hydrolase